MLTDPVQNLTSLSWGGGCESFIIQRVCAWGLSFDYQQTHNRMKFSVQISMPLDPVRQFISLWEQNIVDLWDLEGVDAEIYLTH
jgi:hypothetical protein